ncbi:MAG: zf-HC2 domain-containing protein [Ruminococcus sp.]|jgi:hypothetical protein|nr:zf-HC2 domain-containing protein [Ruminococcus sp.]
MISHNAVRDLLPSYIDGICSEETQKEIKEHLLACSECFKTYEAMAAEVGTPPPLTAEEREEEIKKLNYMRKVKNKAILKWIIIVLAIVAVLGGTIFALCYGVALDSSEVGLVIEVSENDVTVNGESKPILMLNIHLQNINEIPMVVYPWDLDVLHVKWGDYEKGALHQKILNVRAVPSFMTESVGYTSGIMISESFDETYDEYEIVIKFKDQDIVITKDDILKMIEKYENR